MLGLDLYRHWSAEHRTALWFPNPHNNYRVNEIYLRYGKSEAKFGLLEMPSHPCSMSLQTSVDFRPISISRLACVLPVSFTSSLSGLRASNETLIPPMVSRYSDWCFGQHNRLVETTLSLEKPASPDKSRLFENASHFGP